MKYLYLTLRVIAIFLFLLSIFIIWVTGTMPTIGLSDPDYFTPFHYPIYVSIVLTIFLTVFLIKKSYWPYLRKTVLMSIILISLVFIPLLWYRITPKYVSFWVERNCVKTGESKNIFRTDTDKPWFKHVCDNGDIFYSKDNKKNDRRFEGDSIHFPFWLIEDEAGFFIS